MHSTRALELTHLNAMQPSPMLYISSVFFPALTSPNVCCENGQLQMVHGILQSILIMTKSYRYVLCFTLLNTIFIFPHHIAYILLLNAFWQDTFFYYFTIHHLHTYIIYHFCLVVMYYQCVFLQIKIDQMLKLQQIVKHGMSCVNCPISQHKCRKWTKCSPLWAVTKE